MHKRRNNIISVLVVIIAILFLVPLFMVLINSSKDNNSIIQSPLAMPANWSLLWKNITTIWVNENVGYPRALFSSVLITVVSLTGITISSAMAAWVLERSHTKTSRFLYYMFVAAMVIPFQVVMFPLVKWFKEVGGFLHIPLLRSYIGIVIAYMGFGCSLSIFMFHGFVKSIPLGIEEAAEIDGANKITVFFKIILPILKPTVVTVVILNGIWVWNDYLLPSLVLGKGTPVQTLPLAVANFAGAFLKSWDLMMTAILLALIPVVVIFVLLQKYIIKGMVDGSLK
jgi:raffinose/stachyose/melibiose transport system permease protein